MAEAALAAGCLVALQKKLYAIVIYRFCFSVHTRLIPVLLNSFIDRPVGLKCGQVSVSQLVHLVKVSVSEKAWLGMVKHPWKRLDGALMMPDVVRMFKAEKIEG